MPSPFPGMDPYLEQAALWPGVHGTLIAVLRELLASVLAPRFWVDIEERLYVEEEAAPPRAIRPDLSVTQSGARRDAAAVEVLPAAGFVVVAEVLELPVRETYLVIRELPGRRVVTVVEVLSPANKSPRGRGFSEYRRKRSDVFASDASLVEIDLLRVGERPMVRGALMPHDYRILLHRSWERPRAWAAGWRIPDPIPAVPIPLLPEDPPVVLDLAQALRLVYDRGAYRLVLDHAHPPDPPLPEPLVAWARGLLAAGTE